MHQAALNFNVHINTDMLHSSPGCLTGTPQLCGPCKTAVKTSQTMLSFRSPCRCPNSSSNNYFWSTLGTGRCVILELHVGTTEIVRQILQGLVARTILVKSRVKGSGTKPTSTAGQLNMPLVQDKKGNGTGGTLREPRGELTHNGCHPFN